MDPTAAARFEQRKPKARPWLRPCARPCLRRRLPPTWPREAMYPTAAARFEQRKPKARQRSRLHAPPSPRRRLPPTEWQQAIQLARARSRPVTPPATACLLGERHQWPRHSAHRPQPALWWEAARWKSARRSPRAMTSPSAGPSAGPSAHRRPRLRPATEARSQPQVTGFPAGRGQEQLWRRHSWYRAQTGRLTPCHAAPASLRVPRPQGAAGEMSAEWIMAMLRVPVDFHSPRRCPGPRYRSGRKPWTEWSTSPHPQGPHPEKALSTGRRRPLWQVEPVAERPLG